MAHPQATRRQSIRTRRLSDDRQTRTESQQRARLRRRRGCRRRRSAKVLGNDCLGQPNRCSNLRGRMSLRGKLLDLVRLSRLGSRLWRRSGVEVRLIGRDCGDRKGHFSPRGRNKSVPIGNTRTNVQRFHRKLPLTIPQLPALIERSGRSTCPRRAQSS